MRTSKKAAVAAAGLAILAAVGTAATASGATPSPNPKTATSPKTAEPESEVVAAAAALGVSPEALVAAIVSGKQSFASAGGPVTNEEFAAAVAAQLGRPVDQVQTALIPVIEKPGHSSRPENKTDNDGTDPNDSPFATDAAVATLAARLNVTQNEAKSALATILHLAAADGGIDTASAGFRDVAAGLGVTAGQLQDALGELKASFNNG